MKTLVILALVFGASCAVDDSGIKPFGLDTASYGGSGPVTVGAGGKATGGAPGTRGMIAVSASGGAGGTATAALTGGAPGTGGALAPGTGGAQAPSNMITNGDFSRGDQNWVLSPLPANSSATRSIRNGMYCTAIGGGNFATLGWPSVVLDAFSIVEGKTYTLRYKASTTQPPPMYAQWFTARVGQATAPWTPDCADLREALTTEIQSFEHTFVATRKDAGAGLVFVMGGGNLPVETCIGAVSLTEQ